MSVTIEELLKEYSPQQQKEYLQEWGEAITIMLPRLKDAAPEVIADLMSKLDPETLAILVRLANENLKKNESENE